VGRISKKSGIRMRTIKKILVANRGEIALRIMRTARKLGIRTVAVYSEVDRVAPFVRFADEAAYLGPSPSSESYLKMELIIKIATELKVDAIHPGYGFLSENAVFAEKVANANIIFIGPKPHAIRVMGSKLAAKDAVKDYDIPMVPGIDEAIEDVEKAKEIATKIGLPILIKASAGGGGKGMRIVEKLEELGDQMARAISEAKSAFGDGSVFIEKYVGSPRHIEIQVLADEHGNVVHLFERDCSIQRRHQKVVEEAPSAVLTPELRDAMGAAAVKVAKACDYVGAGTVEFLLDSDMQFYFLEMNTRLQVEHPVTELITGLDLVEEQILIAQGQALSYTQDELKIDGHALELRIYSEDPLQDFTPDIGTLEVYRKPTAAGVRVDDGYEEGMEIPIFYDSMIAKLIVHAPTRAMAIQLMTEAIDQYKISGVATTLPFGRFVMKNEYFQSGDFDTHFVKKHYNVESILEEKEVEESIAAQLAGKVWMEHVGKLQIAQHGASSWQKSRCL